MSAALQEMGLSITGKGLAFEIDGIPDSANQKFSRRTAVIEREAKRRGITDAKEKAKLGALTREAKDKKLNPIELTKLWTEAHGGRAAQVMDVWQRMKTPPKARTKMRSEPLRARDHLGTRLFLATADAANARQSAGGKSRCGAGASSLLLDQVGGERNAAQGSDPAFRDRHIRVEQLQRVIAGVPNLLRKELYGRIMVTTKQVLEEEKRMVAWVRQGRDAVAPLCPDM